MTPRVRTVPPALTLGLLLAIGCGGDGKPPTVAATGKVTFNKTTPPVGALVVFHPTDPVLGKAMSNRPVAEVGEDGTFALTTYERGDGAPPGEYGVTIDWRPAAPGAKPKLAIGDGGDGGGAAGKPALKPKFSSPGRPAFTVTVTPGGPNDFAFEVD